MTILVCLYLAYVVWCTYTIYLIAHSNSKACGLGDVTFDLFCRWVMYNRFKCLNIFYVRTVLSKTLEMNKPKSEPVKPVEDDKSPIAGRIAVIEDVVRREVFMNMEYRNYNPYVDILYSFIPKLEKPMYYLPPTDDEQLAIHVIVNNALLRHCRAEPLPVDRMTMDDFNYRQNLKLLLLTISSKRCQHVFNDKSVIIEYFNQFDQDEKMKTEYTLLEILEEHATGALEATFIDVHDHSATIRQYDAIEHIDIDIINATIKRLSDLKRINILYGVTSDAKRVVFELTEQGPWIVTKGRAEE